MPGVAELEGDSVMVINSKSRALNKSSLCAERSLLLLRGRIGQLL